MSRDKEKVRLVNGLAKILEEDQTAFVNSKEALLEVLKKLRFLDKKDLSEQEIIEIQKVTCYDSVGFCCGTQKPCLLRDTALYLLRIDKAFFESEKRKMVFYWLDDHKDKEVERKELSGEEKQKVAELDTEELRRQGAITPDPEQEGEGEEDDEEKEE